MPNPPKRRRLPVRRQGAVAAFRLSKLPTRILSELGRAADLAQIDLSLRDREQHVPLPERLSASEPVSSCLLRSHEGIDRARRIGLAPASQIEEALSLHGQLDAALGAHGVARVGLIWERRVVGDAIGRPRDRRAIDRHRELGMAGARRELGGGARLAASLRGYSRPRADLIHKC